MDVWQGGIRSILFLVGPALQADPPYTNLLWEDRGGLTLLWLTPAVVGGVWIKGRRYQACVTLLLCLFAVGGAYFMQELPGFNLFRQHTRMFVILGCPIALLAGAATDALFDPSPTGIELRRRGRQVLLRLSVGLLILAGGFAVRTILDGKSLRFEWYWLSLALTVPAAWWLFGRSAGRMSAALWAALLLFDLGALTVPLVATRPEDAVFSKPPWLAEVASNGTVRERILDRNEPVFKTGTPLGAGAPLAMLYGIESLRGYCPLDNLRYKQYLQFIAGSDEPLSPLGGRFTSPVISDFPIVHQSLLDLLGTAYLLQPSAFPHPGSSWQAFDADAEPAAYDFITGGIRRMPSYTLYQNPTRFPRAFVVFQAEPLPSPPEILARLSTTDLRRVVLLEGDGPSESPGYSAERSAVLKEYHPNRIVVDVGDGPAGWIVLTDIWYPGWICEVDGQPAAIRRANYLFRAVQVPERAKEVVFRFEPATLRRGRAISLGTLAFVAVLLPSLRLLRRRVASPDA
jgi:hypothetical protein